MLKVVLILLAFLFIFACSSKEKEIFTPQNKSENFITGNNGAVSSASKYATIAGIEILQKGGNAIDAAVTIGFVLAVTYPQAGNIGGGGFMLIRTSDEKITSIDYREKAPLASTRNMFLDEQGNFLPDKSQVGHLSAGVPGSVAGMLYALEKYGTMNLKDILEPAIQLAENGFEIEEHFAQSLNSNKNSFNEFESTKKVFTKDGGFKNGELFIQKDLAKTLKLISTQGRKGFYDGENAELIEREMKNHGGIITKEDLLNYEPVERKTVSTTYKGYDIYSMAPPSSGGIALINLLNMIENDKVPDTNNVEETSEYYRVIIESMKRVYADRSEYLGDPDFYKVPVETLISKDYAKRRRSSIHDTVTSSDNIKPGLNESEQTTHYSVIDKNGNMVSVTTTLNNTYGSFVVVDGAGFLLNDEMDDFASKPGEPNMFGLVGSEANSIQPGKRMLSSMTPTIVLKDKKPYLILGSPGGGRIITTVFRTLINIIDFKLPLNVAIDKPRFHHQWLPDNLQVENGALSSDILNLLSYKGYDIEFINDFGRVDAILIDNDTIYSYSDRRGNGLALTY